MIFHENRLLAEQRILMKYHTLYFSKIDKKKMSQNLSSAAVVIGALRVKMLSAVTSRWCSNGLMSKNINEH